MAKELKAAATTAAENPAIAAETFETSEIASNAPHLFGYSADMATAAFAYGNVKRCTLEDARKIIKAFAERTVN